MVRKTTHIKVTEPAFPFGDWYAPDNLQPAVEEKFSPEGNVQAIQLENVLPQAFGYGSFFGKSKLGLPPLGWGVQDMFTYRTEQGDNALVALGYKGAFVSNDGLAWNEDEGVIDTVDRLVDNLGNGIGTVQQSAFSIGIKSSIVPPVGLVVDAPPTTEHLGINPEIKAIIPARLDPENLDRVAVDAYATVKLKPKAATVTGITLGYSASGFDPAIVETVTILYIPEETATGELFTPIIKENIVTRAPVYLTDTGLDYSIPAPTVDPIVGHTYSLSVFNLRFGTPNGKSYSYVALVGDTLTTVLTSLVAGWNTAHASTGTATLNADNSISVTYIASNYGAGRFALGTVQDDTPLTLTAVSTVLETVSLPPALNANATISDTLELKPLALPNEKFVAIKVTGAIPTANGSTTTVLLIDGKVIQLGQPDANGYYFVQAPKHTIGLAYTADDQTKPTTSITVHSVTGDSILTSGIGTANTDSIARLKFATTTYSLPSFTLHMFMKKNAGAIAQTVTDPQWDYMAVGAGNIDLTGAPLVSGINNPMQYIDQTASPASFRAANTRSYTIGPFPLEMEYKVGSTTKLHVNVILPVEDYMGLLGYGSSNPLLEDLGLIATQMLDVQVVLPDGRVSALVQGTGGDTFQVGIILPTPLDITGSFQTINPWTKAVVRNRLYCYRQGLGVILRLKSDASGWERLQPTFMNMQFIRGISSAKGRLVAWDSDNSIYRGSVSIPVDFVPSLATQANVEKVDSLKGRLVTILPLGDDFIIYATSSIIHARYIGGTFVYAYKAITAKSGILNADAVTEATDNEHFAWSHEGLIAVGAGQTQQISPEASAYIGNTNLPVSLKYIKNRHLVINNSPVDSSYLVKREIGVPPSVYLPELHLPPIPGRTRQLMIDYGLDVEPDGEWQISLMIPKIYIRHKTTGLVTENINWLVQHPNHDFDHVEVFYSPIITHNVPMYYALLQLILWDLFLLEYDRWSTHESWPSPAYWDTVLTALTKDWDFRFGTMYIHYGDRSGYDPAYESWGQMFRNYQWWTGIQYNEPPQAFFDFFWTPINSSSPITHSYPHNSALSFNGAIMEIPLKDRMIILQDSPYGTAGYDLPAVTLPASSFLGVEGSNAPVYPTYPKAIILDTLLKNWGSCDVDHKLLVDYSPINERSFNPILGETRTKFTYDNFGNTFALLDARGQLHLCTDAPDASLVVFGKLGYTRTGVTRHLQSKADLLDSVTAKVKLRGSLNGKQFDPRIAAEFEGDVGLLELNKVLAAKWFTLEVSGQFRLKGLEFTGEIGGQR